MKAYVGAESPKAFAIDSSDSSQGPWQSVSTVSIDASWTSVKQWTFNTVNARYWKVSISETFDGLASTINYIRFFQSQEPTPAPTPAPTPLVDSSAQGDPHMRNIRGESFDVKKQGLHTLLQIPRNATL